MQYAEAMAFEPAQTATCVGSILELNPVFDDDADDLERQWNCSLGLAS